MKIFYYYNPSMNWDYALAPSEELSFKLVFSNFGLLKLWKQWILDFNLPFWRNISLTFHYIQYSFFFDGSRMIRDEGHSVDYCYFLLTLFVIL